MVAERGFCSPFSWQSWSWQLSMMLVVISGATRITLLIINLNDSCKFLIIPTIATAVALTASGQSRACSSLFGNDVVVGGIDNSSMAHSKEE